MNVILSAKLSGVWRIIEVLQCVNYAFIDYVWLRLKKTLQNDFFRIISKLYLETIGKLTESLKDFSKLCALNILIRIKISKLNKVVPMEIDNKSKKNNNNTIKYRRRYKSTY